MKLRNLFFASLAMVTFAACSNDNDPLPSPEAQAVDAGDVKLTITTKTSDNTKAEGDNTLAGTIAESTINTLDVYVYVSDGNNGWTYFAEKNLTNPTAAGQNPTEQNENYYSVTFAGLKTETKYKFIAVANKTIENTPTYADLIATTLTYGNPTSNFVMSGSQEKSGFVEASNTNAATANTVTINISRRLAAVEVSGLTLNLPASVPDNYKNAKATVQDIYLVDINSQAKLGDNSASNLESEIKGNYIFGSTYNIYSNQVSPNPFGTYNKYLSALKKDSPTDNYLAIELKQPNDQGPQVTKDFNDYRLYAFPTSITTDGKHYPMLKLRVLFEKDGYNSEVRYYTIKLKHGTNGAQELHNNVIYQVSAAITGIGSSKDDETETTAGDVAATIQVKAWTVVTQNAGDITD